MQVFRRSSVGEKMSFYTRIYPQVDGSYAMKTLSSEAGMWCVQEHKLSRKPSEGRRTGEITHEGPVRAGLVAPLGPSCARLAAGTRPSAHVGVWLRDIRVPEFCLL